MKTYIVLVISVILVAATAVSANSMSVYAQGGGANMTGDISKLAPDGSATGLVAQGEKFFVVVCPQEFQIIKQCQILVGTPTVVAVK
ncbi:MAG: hypothetical protein ACRD8Z_19970 [Nitrososphaeraceae archaeon]